MRTRNLHARDVYRTGSSVSLDKQARIYVFDGHFQDGDCESPQFYPPLVHRIQMLRIGECSSIVSTRREAKVHSFAVYVFFRRYAGVESSEQVDGERETLEMVVVGKKCGLACQAVDPPT